MQKLIQSQTLYCSPQLWHIKMSTQGTAAPLTWNSLPPAILNCDSLSLFSNQDLKLICFLPLSANYSTYLVRQRLCSRLTALWRYINFVLLSLLLLLLKYLYCDWLIRQLLRAQRKRMNQHQYECIQLGNSLQIKVHFHPSDSAYLGLCCNKVKRVIVAQPREDVLGVEMMLLMNLGHKSDQFAPLGQRNTDLMIK